MRQTGTLLICVAMILLGPACVVAATMTVPLSPVVTAGPHGDYLSAEFDFGTAFSNVESLTLEFTLPNGYQGFLSSTGTSTSSRNLEVMVHDPAIPLDDPRLADLRFRRSQSLFDVPATTEYALRFKDLSEFGKPLLAGAAWPKFMLQGYGQVSLTDILMSSSQQLVDGSESDNFSWSPPSEISGLRLTVVGTLVPEPNSALICLIGVASLTMFRGRHRSAPVR